MGYFHTFQSFSESPGKCQSYPQHQPALNTITQKLSTDNPPLFAIVSLASGFEAVYIVFQRLREVRQTGNGKPTKLKPKDLCRVGVARARAA